MQSGVIRGHIRNEFIAQHCQFIALNGCLLILPASSLLSPTRISRISRILFRCKQRFSPCLTVKTPKESKIREIREIRVGKIQHLTFKINHHESKLEIRHQFRHHSPHRRPQHLLHAELRQLLSRSRISRIFTSLGDEYLLPCHQH